MLIGTDSEVFPSMKKWYNKLRMKTKSKHQATKCLSFSKVRICRTHPKGCSKPVLTNQIVVLQGNQIIEML